MHLYMPSGKCQPFCLGLSTLMQYNFLRSMPDDIHNLYRKNVAAASHISVPQALREPLEILVSNKADIDSFTASLHNPDGRHVPAISAVQGVCQWLWKTMEIPTAHVGPPSIIDATLAYI